MGIVGGLAFLVAGEYWQRRYPIWAQPVTGGGLAILYLSIFVAFSLYDFIPPVAAFGLFFLVTLTAAGLALKNESMVIAILGIIGGFVTPILLKDELPDQRLLLAYVLVLDLGVLGLATFRNWRWFNLLGLAGSLGLYWFWYDRLDPSLLLAMVGITLIFLIFIGATSLFPPGMAQSAGSGRPRPDGAQRGSVLRHQLLGDVRRAQAVDGRLHRCCWPWYTVPRRTPLW